MAYSCGYWKNATSLDEAQEQKFDLICRKLSLKKGDRILDVGSGWGGFAVWAAERYEVSVVGITVSNEQAQYMRAKCAHLQIEVRVCDWRDLHGERFDHIVSIGMFEHVGAKNYRDFFKKNVGFVKRGWVVSVTYDWTQPHDAESRAMVQQIHFSQRPLALNERNNNCD